ncbi:M48 family metalloprotease [Kitasatospora sp. NBC_00374]|uniref:M48 family metalloprotease n=1 Tax=Kitasatospora sp. NBC_00374 TaxID=2975964 RepID=UPI0030E1742B
MDGEESPVHRVLDPRAVPAGTALRFALLVITMLVASIGTLTELLPLLPSRNTLILCEFAVGYDPDGRMLEALVSDDRGLSALRQCASADQVYPYWSGLAGAAVVLLAAGVLYLRLPRWKARRQRLMTLEEADGSGELRAELMGLVRIAGLRAVPDFLVDPARFDRAAAAFGRAGRRSVCLYAGLVNSRTSDPAGFRAVVLHELAHIRNRDVDFGYAVTALWRVFMVLVVVPAIVVYGTVLGAADLLGWFTGADEVFWPAARPALLRSMAETGFLVVLVVLARADVLRHRELYADADALALGADRAVWEQAREAPRVSRLPASVTAWWRSHPTWAERRSSLDDPAVLFSLGPAQMFLIGGATLTSAHTLDALWNVTAAVVIVALPPAAITTLTARRWAAYTAHHGGRPPTGARPGLMLGLGLVTGELLTGTTSGSRWLPDHPEVLLVLFLGGAAYVVWLLQCARIRPRLRAGRGLRAVPLAALAAGTLVGAAAVSWWLRSGYLFTTGDLMTAGGLRQTVVDGFPGPWEEHTGELSWITSVLPALAVEGVNRLSLAAATALWVYPLVRWLRRSPETAPGLRQAVLSGLLGGVLCVAGMAAARAGLYPDRPPLGGRGESFALLSMWWTIVAIWAGVAVTSAVVAATARRLWLPRALVASGVASSAALAGQFVLGAADGCLGPLRAMGDSCLWVPGGVLPALPLLAGAVVPAVFGAALVAVAAGWAANTVRACVRAPRPRRAPGLPADPVARPRTRAGLVAGRAGAALLLVTAVLGPATALSGDRHSGPAAATPAPPPRAATSERVRSFQLIAWFALSGRADILELTSDYGEFEKEFRRLEAAANDPRQQLVRIDGERLRPVCTALAEHATEAVRHPGIPDAGLDDPWQSWLTTTRQAGQGCVDLLDRPGDDREKNDAMLSALVDGYLQADPAVSPLLDRVTDARRYWPNLVHVNPS